jgi:hypothetical protein
MNNPVVVDVVQREQVVVGFSTAGTCAVSVDRECLLLSSAPSTIGGLDAIRQLSVWADSAVPALARIAGETQRLVPVGPACISQDLVQFVAGRPFSGPAHSHDMIQREQIHRCQSTAGARPAVTPQRCVFQCGQSPLLPRQHASPAAPDLSAISPASLLHPFMRRVLTRVVASRHKASRPRGFTHRPGAAA